MAQSLDDVKRRILARVSLPTLIGETVPLQSRSGRQVGLCPFHNEKSPSFTIYDDRYYCFGCKENGDAIEFVKKTQGLSFIDALRLLANKFGVEAPELDESTRQLRQQRADQSLYALMQEALQYFIQQLHSPTRPASKEAMTYLLSRGFTEETIKDYGFGLTPDEPFGLVRHLRAKGFQIEDMVACCLATLSNRDGRPYDFFRNRIMIPIRDPQGRIIAFGGRTTDGHPAKYMNSGATKLFDKAHTLFGLDKARKSIRDRQRAIVVEGYMDAMQLWQQGIGEAVACLGTAFTEWHLKHLKHATSQVILLFDGDTAGQKATMAAVSVALTVPDVRIKAVELTGGDDPDSFVRQHGVEALEGQLTKATDLLDFAIRKRLAGTHLLAIPELVSKEFIPWLAQVPDRIQQSTLLLRIAQLTGIPSEQIERELRPPGFNQGYNQNFNSNAGGIRPLQRSGADTTNRPAAPLRAPLKPLEPVIFDLFGHVFHALPSEIGPAQVAILRADLQRELEIDEAYISLLQEMLVALESGHSPAALALSDFSASLMPEIAKLMTRLQQSASAFTCNDRLLRLEKARGHARLRKNKNSVQALKSQLSRLAAQPRSPENDAEIRQLLSLIQELSREPNPDSPQDPNKPSPADLR